MSIEALNWALEIGEREKLEPTARHILLVLANRADEEGYVYPSINWIRTRTGYARSTVNQHLKALNSRKPSPLLTKVPRHRDDGAQTSNLYQLAMQQPGLPLGTPPSDSRTGVAGKRIPGQRLADGGGPAGGPYTQDKTKEETKDAGRASPSPVAAAFKAYAEGIKRKYGADYPPSAKANGQLANLVARVGGDNASAVVGYYLGCQNPFYAKVKHKLDYLVRDCEQLYMALQAATGGAPAASTAHVALLAHDGTVKRRLDDYPAGDPEAIARRALREYSTLIRNLEPKYVSVVQGANRNRYSLEELKPKEGAPA